MYEKGLSVESSTIEAPLTLEFSVMYKCSNYIVKTSPSGHLIAWQMQNKLFINEISQPEKPMIFECKDIPREIEWSSDSRYILCVIPKRSLIQVWCVENTSWKCSIDEGAVGLTAARWSPDSLHILSTAELQIRITVWSLAGKRATSIEYPKFPKKGISFSEDGLFLAVAQRWDCKDSVCIVNATTWALVKHKVLLYDMQGRPVGSYSDDRLALGVRCVSWSPDGLFVAVGSYDQRVEILNVLTWKPMAIFNHQDQFRSNTEFFKEVTELAAVSSYKLGPSKPTYDLLSGPIAIDSIVQDTAQPNPRVGVSQVIFSENGEYLATRNDNMPHAVFIWSMSTLEAHAILIHRNPVRGMSWRPGQPMLALCTDVNLLLFWSPGGGSCLQIPSELDG
eukprot:Ihof_evm5s99 gene=Ihof_evmTU5s99